MHEVDHEVEQVIAEADDIDPKELGLTEVEAWARTLDDQGEIELAVLAGRDDPDRYVALGAWLLGMGADPALAPQVATELLGWDVTATDAAAYSPAAKATRVANAPRPATGATGDVMALIQATLHPSWHAMAACRGLPTAWWHPERQPGRDNHARAAIRICAGCPVRVRCLISGVDGSHEAGVGIRGGAGGKSARALARAYRRMAPEERHVPLLDVDPDDDDWCGCGWCAMVRRHFSNIADPSTAVPLDANGPSAKHGTRATYNKGCRCAQCRLAALDDHRPDPGVAA